MGRPDPTKLKGCFHCQPFFAQHGAKDCKGTPMLMVPYRALTSLDLSRAYEVYGKTKRPITVNALLSYVLQGKAVSAVLPVVAIDDISNSPR
ncbi:hypothetical protein GYMLUDRAFT_252203 [Collybiopsis luxurians FD-317 M1]|uniref:Uncharacterized protein n=1 Tax=Collybiopsis luxurians FD-317 M1 TaxID=944289 RepID=A0A0D0C913_9AGAR|nr:hypothetical protein GYMLUDRAFT_252203 [Collybiopsis luxurians FD-317 M1]